jgi:hypothetical protein
MYPQRMVRHTLGLALLVTLVVSAVSACGGGGDEEAKARPLPEAPKDLRPGEYRSEEFKPSLTFRVGKGWETLIWELYDHLALTRGATWELHFLTPQEVYKPTTGAPNAVEAPEDMVGWFRQHPYLQTSKPKPVTVGGVEGERFDVAVGEVPEGYSGACGSDCVDLFRDSGSSTQQAPKGVKIRAIVLEDVKGETVTIGFSAPVSEFDYFAPEAQKVIDTVKWKGA